MNAEARRWLREAVQVLVDTSELTATPQAKSARCMDFRTLADCLAEEAAALYPDVSADDAATLHALACAARDWSMATILPDGADEPEAAAAAAAALSAARRAVARALTAWTGPAPAGAAPLHFVLNFGEFHAGGPEPGDWTPAVACGFLDVVRGMCASPNAWYYRELACGPATKAWEVLLEEMLARHVSERMRGLDRVVRRCVFRARPESDASWAELCGRQPAYAERGKLRHALTSGRFVAPLQSTQAPAAPALRPRPFKPVPNINMANMMTYGDFLDDGFWAAFGGRGVVHAGGSVCESLLQREREWERTRSDVDLFLCGVRSREEACALADDVVAYLRRRAAHENARRGKSLRDFPRREPFRSLLVDVTPNAVNVTVMSHRSVMSHRWDGEVVFPIMEIQLVTRLFASVAQLLLFFDFGPARFAFDGRTYYATASALYASANGAFLLEPAMRTYPKRVRKYDLRGFVAMTVATDPRVRACARLVADTDDVHLLQRMYRRLNLASLLAYAKLERLLLPCAPPSKPNDAAFRRGIAALPQEEFRSYISGETACHVKRADLMYRCAVDAQHDASDGVLGSHGQDTPDGDRLTEEERKRTVADLERLDIVFDLFLFGTHHFPCDERYVGLPPRTATAVLEPRRWRLRPAQYLVNEDDGHDFASFGEEED